MRLFSVPPFVGRLLPVAQVLGDSVLHSYSQLFFAKSRAFGALGLVASVLDWQGLLLGVLHGQLGWGQVVDAHLGLWGLLGVLMTNGLALALRFHAGPVRDGLYGANALLVSLALASYVAPNPAFGLLLASACVLTLLLSVVVLNGFAGAGIPPLSFGFMLSLWLLLLAVRQYNALLPDTDSIYRLNELYATGGMGLVRLHEWVADFPRAPFWRGYLSAFSAILWQHNPVVGLLLATGMWLSSRIAWSLSLLGYAAGYALYGILGVGTAVYVDSHVGFNFMLTAMAIGGFFFVPTWQSYLLALAAMPLTAVFATAGAAALTPLMLPVFSLPFLLTVWVVLYALKFSGQRFLHPVAHQHYVPEYNHYAWRNHSQRFRGAVWYRIGLPFWGAWRVSQGHAGAYTHKEDWQYAWDFDQADDAGQTWVGSGTRLEEFRCYNLPVCAPAAGTVVALADHVPDNPPGEVNIRDNWGNSLVIQHGEGLYSKLSHLRAGTLRVALGEYVQQGQQLAQLGNSGRSPEPHLHFQLQATPYIGARTLRYPLAYFLRRSPAGWALAEFQIPAEGEVVQNVQPVELLRNAFNWVPGKILRWEMPGIPGGILRWEALTTAANHAYLYCHQSGATAYFVNDGLMCYFTAYEGPQSALLYRFYLGAYKTLLAYEKQLVIADTVPLHQVQAGALRWPQDLLAPIRMFSAVRYEARYASIDNAMLPQHITLRTDVTQRLPWLRRHIQTAHIEVDSHGIATFSCEAGGRHQVLCRAS